VPPPRSRHPWAQLPKNSREVERGKKKKNKKRSRKGGLKPSPTLVNTAISFTSTFPVFLSRRRSRGQGLLLILAPFCFQRGQQQFRRWGRGRFRQRAIPAKAGLETIQANTRARCRRGREDGRITLGCRRRKKEKKLDHSKTPKNNDNIHAKDHQLIQIEIFMIPSQRSFQILIKIKNNDNSNSKLKKPF